MSEKHGSHVTRGSDSSLYDEICINCGATDKVPGGWGTLVHSCSKPVGNGGKTLETWFAEQSAIQGIQAEERARFPIR